MNTLNTPVHVRLWHRDFWLMAFASLALTMSVCVLLPVMPHWLMTVENFSHEEAGLLMGVFGLGMYLSGPFCSWLVQRYRRNVVCIWAMLAVVLSMALLWYINGLHSEFVEFWKIGLLRLLQGASFGLAQMVLSSTLIIDTCESVQRTEANYYASWFSRFGVVLGVFGALWFSEISGVSVADGFDGVMVGGTGLGLLAAVLVKMVSFPFRTPEEGVHLASLDRFYLTHGTVLFLNFLLVSTVMGLLVALPFEASFYAFMAGGFVLAILAQRFVFHDAELESEVVSGLILLIAALLVLLNYQASPVAAVLIGLGIGIVSSRFLLFFIKLSRHCQRGTSQSTYFLGWETGLALGLALGYGLFDQQPKGLLYTAFVLTLCALLMYHFYTHAWFMRNKNR